MSARETHQYARRTFWRKRGKEYFDTDYFTQQCVGLRKTTDSIEKISELHIMVDIRSVKNEQINRCKKIVSVFSKINNNSPHFLFAYPQYPGVAISFIRRIAPNIFICKQGEQRHVHAYLSILPRSVLSCPAHHLGTQFTPDTSEKTDLL